jgi:hypothetical protein
MSAATPNLTHLLTKTRRRLRLELVAQVSALALAGAIPLISSAHVVVRLLQLPEVVWLWSAAGLSLSIIGFAALYVAKHWPHHADAARAADGHFETAELFSSAWDAQEKESVVAQALREQAEQSALAQEPKSIRMALRQPLTILALSLVATTTAVQLISIFSPNGPAPVIATAPGVPLALRDDVVAVAELLEQRAAEQDDAFVSSIARSLRELVETTDIEADVEQLSAQLAEPRDYTTAAMDAWEEPDMAPLAEVFEELVERSQVAAGTATGNNVTSESSSQTSETSFEKNSLREKIETLSKAESASESMAQGQPFAEEDAGYDYDQMPVEALAAQSEDDASSSSTTGAPAAPSDDATGGASAMAGDGTGELDGMGQATAELTFDDAPELELDTIDMGEGQRIEEFIVPQTQDVIRLNAADPTLGDHWVHQDEAEVNRRSVGASDQAVASRYRLMLRDGVTP